VHRHQEVHGDDREDRGDDDRGGGLAARVAAARAAVATGGPGRVAERLRAVRGGVVGGAHRRFSIQFEIPSARAENRKAATAMITDCAAAMPMSLYWNAKAW